MANPTLQKLASFFAQLNIRCPTVPDTDNDRSLGEIWREVAGRAIADHTDSIYASGDALVVHANSPLWANKIRHQQTFLLCGVQANGYAGIVNIRVRVAPASSATQSRAAAAPRLSPATAELLRKVATTVSDQRLRQSLNKLAEHGDRCSGGRR
ncbi:MAG: DUF721 domain-containing protein [Gammaproteobacteria bacterium]|nr:DUF721 domain-containing protein [Gammaproteobacteria bacterium]